MLQPLSSPIIAAINHLLASQSWARARLVPYAGEAIRLQIGATVIDVAVSAEGTLLPAQDLPSAVTIAVPLALLPRLLARDPQARREVSVTGNVGLAADLEYLFGHLRWDVEADLSRVVGDIAAHRLTQVGAAAARLPGEVASSLARSTRQFLTDEQSLVARADEVAGYVAEVDHLRDDAERLAKRVALLDATRVSRS
ncbi:MAG: hypothetical protein H7125_05425 [Proteobacteria bacterium]|nr:hypothetical protein [Burkholderiales bacterium]